MSVAIIRLGMLEIAWWPYDASQPPGSQVSLNAVTMARCAEKPLRVGRAMAHRPRWSGNPAGAAVLLVAQGTTLQNAKMGGLKRSTIRLFKKCGESAGIGGLSSDDGLCAVRRTYRQAIEEHPDRLIMLCDRSIVLARSDRARKLRRE